VVEIIDNGPGIPAHVLPRIFEPFYTTKAQGEGTGLGLDICRKIVEKHQGTISVDSVPGRTAFKVVLPINPEVSLAPVAVLS
jgi:two-component system, NtrC family, sensor kinase